MYSDRFSLPFLAEVSIASAERRRPGLGPWTPKVREALDGVFRAELAEVRARFFELSEDASHWEKVERNLLDVCFPRYCTVAEKQTWLEQHDYGLWRGGDLLARGLYAFLGLMIGFFLVKTPWIPIPTTWDALILAFLLAAPFLPDAQIALKQRRFRKALGAIVEDMREAEAQQKLYQPLPLGGGLDAAPPRLESPSTDSVLPPEGGKTRNER